MTLRIMVDESIPRRRHRKHNGTVSVSGGAIWCFVRGAFFPVGRQTSYVIQIVYFLLEKNDSIQIKKNTCYLSNHMKCLISY